MTERVKQTEADCSNRLTDMKTELNTQKRQFESTVTEQQTEIYSLTALLKLKTDADVTAEKRTDGPTETVVVVAKSKKKAISKKTSVKKAPAEKKALVKKPSKVKREEDGLPQEKEKLHGKIRDKFVELEACMRGVVSSRHRDDFEEVVEEGYREVGAARRFLSFDKCDLAKYTMRMMGVIEDWGDESECGEDKDVQRIRADIESLLGAAREEGNVKV